MSVTTEQGLAIIIASLLVGMFVGVVCCILIAMHTK